MFKTVYAMLADEGCNPTPDGRQYVGQVICETGVDDTFYYFGNERQIRDWPIAAIGILYRIMLFFRKSYSCSSFAASIASCKALLISSISVANPSSADLTVSSTVFLTSFSSSCFTISVKEGTSQSQPQMTVCLNLLVKRTIHLNYSISDFVDFSFSISFSNF